MKRPPDSRFEFLNRNHQGIASHAPARAGIDTDRADQMRSRHDWHPAVVVRRTAHTEGQPSRPMVQTRHCLAVASRDRLRLTPILAR